MRSHHVSTGSSGLCTVRSPLLLLLLVLVPVIHGQQTTTSRPNHQHPPNTTHHNFESNTGHSGHMNITTTVRVNEGVDNLAVFVPSFFDTGVEVKCMILLDDGVSLLALTSSDVRVINLETKDFEIKLSESFPLLTEVWKYTCLQWDKYWIWITLDRMYIVRIQSLLDGKGIELVGGAATSDDEEPPGIEIPYYERAPEGILWDEYLILAGRPPGTRGKLPLHVLHLRSALQRIESGQTLTPKSPEWLPKVEVTVPFVAHLYLSIIADKWLLIVPDYLVKYFVSIELQSLVTNSSPHPEAIVRPGKADGALESGNDDFEGALVFHSYNMTSPIQTLRYGCPVSYHNFMLILGGEYYLPPHEVDISPIIMTSFNVQHAMFGWNSSEVVPWQRITISDIPYINAEMASPLKRYNAQCLPLPNGDIIYSGGLRHQTYFKEIVQFKLYETISNEKCPSITVNTDEGAAVGTVDIRRYLATTTDENGQKDKVQCLLPNPPNRVYKLTREQDYVKDMEWDVAPKGWAEEGGDRWKVHQKHTQTLEKEVPQSKITTTENGPTSTTEANKAITCETTVKADIGTSSWFVVWTPESASGGKKICSLNITVKDTTRPELSCSPTLKWFPAFPEVGTPAFNTTIMREVNATDNDGVNHEATVIQKEVTTNSAVVHVTVFDFSNNSAQCQILFDFAVDEDKHPQSSKGGFYPDSVAQLGGVGIGVWTAIALGVGGGVLLLIVVVSALAFLRYRGKKLKEKEERVEFSVIPDFTPTESKKQVAPVPAGKLEGQ